VRDCVVLRVAVVAKEGTTLRTLWLGPVRWPDHPEGHGVHGAALTMVTYENFARQPHPDGWLGLHNVFRITCSDT
jgi:hypothetical protein